MEISVNSDEMSASISEVSPGEFKKHVQEGATSFVAKLYSIPSMPRSIGQDVVELTTEFVGESFLPI